MSLLHQESEEMDDAALGEDLTKGTTHYMWATAVSAALVTLGLAFFVLMGQKPPVLTGEVEQVWAEPLHSQTKSVDANGAEMPVSQVEQVLVFARVKLRNQGKEPLRLHQVLANAVMPDGTISSYSAIPADYDRLFEAYPKLTSPHGPALPTPATIEAGATTEGEFVSAFHMSRDQWERRKSIDFTFVFDYLQPLKVVPKAAIIDQPGL